MIIVYMVEVKSENVWHFTSHLHPTMIGAFYHAEAMLDGSDVEVAKIRPVKGSSALCQWLDEALALS